MRGCRPEALAKAAGDEHEATLVHHAQALVLQRPELQGVSIRGGMREHTHAHPPAPTHAHPPTHLPAHERTNGHSAHALTHAQAQAQAQSDAQQTQTRTCARTHILDEQR
jgi:hypothetical protein